MGRNRRFTAAVAGTAAVMWSLFGCTGHPDPGASRTAPRSPAGATAPAHPTATATRPPAKGPGAPQDFTGDGRSDLVVTVGDATIDGVASAGYLAVVPGSATGAAPARTTVFTQNSIGEGPAGQGGEFGSATVSADLDGDGRTDLVTQAGRATVFVIWGGTHASPPAARLHGRAPLTGDFDGDGHPDLLLGDDSPDGAVIDYGPLSRTGKPARTATVSFTPHLPKASASYPNLANALAVGDVNGDGRDDVVTQWTEDDGDTVLPRATVVYYGTASGVVRGPRLTGPDGKDVHSTYGEVTTYTGDINGDGYDDIVNCRLSDSLGDTGRLPPPSRVTVDYGGPHGTPARPAQVFDATTPGLPGTGTGPDGELGRAAAVGDINGDRYADLVLTTTPGDSGRSHPALVLLYGGPDGLAAGHARTIPEAATATRIIDLNGDGYGDLVIGHASPTPGSRGVTVLRGSGHGVLTGSPQEITEDSLGRPATPSAAFGYGFAR